MSLPLPPARTSSSFPEPLRSQQADAWRYGTTEAWAPPLRSWWQSWGRNATLFGLTAASVFLTDLLYSGSAQSAALFMTAVMSILLAHEMGHYLACRYYAVDATLPFFIPSPWLPLLGLTLPWMPLSFVGTFGAVIRIKSPFPHRRALFDIGIGGPLAGFAFCLPVLLLGIQEARIVPERPGGFGFSLGDPLLFQWLVALFKGDVPPGHTVLIGPLGLAAWFGLFVTALNLIPVGQLDGGHVTYALFGSRANQLSRWMWWAALGLVYFSPSWILWVILIRILGRGHPRTLDEGAPVGAGRVLVGVVGLAVFVASFIPEPFVGSWPDLRQALGELLAWLTSR